MAKVVSRWGNEVTVQVTVRLSDSMLDMEAAIQEATNAVGCSVTAEALKRFDTDGSPIRIGARMAWRRSPAASPPSSAVWTGR